ncbi:penicillin acylase family protein [Ferruginibacter sp.]
MQLQKRYFLQIFLCFVLPLQLVAQDFSQAEIASWQKRAKQVNIIRDNYGVPHIYGKTDADAVFGLMYAQCEDDFKRVELNYIEKLGRMAEVKGKEELYNDLMIKMLIDTTDAVNDYNKAPAWLQHLCNAFADGINFYLYNNPGKAVLLKRFQPWYPLLWTDGSIGAINTAGISAAELKNFYSGEPPVAVNKPDEEMLTGSNGFAFAPKITESGHAILYINPHVTFYFRPEAHMVSDEGLNVYGAVTWGQFFIYQGFNEHCGWMHTSSGVDAADLYVEKLSKQNDGWVYEYDKKKRPVITKDIFINYKIGDSILSTEHVKALYTLHGPIMANRNGKVLSMRADNRLLEGLEQCWLRTKANSFKEFKNTLSLRGNISNNTVYADAEGNIAYWHGNRIPVRDTLFNWNQPVDGTIKATEWKGYHTISSIVQSINPTNGWLQNCNSTPYTVAGAASPKQKNYPVYMAPDAENFRGINAVQVLAAEKKYTLDKVIKAGYDTRLSAFELLVPALIDRFEKSTDTAFVNCKDAIAVLKNWDYRCGENSVATTLAVEWGYRIVPVINRIKFNTDHNVGFVEQVKQFISTASANDLLLPFLQTLRELETKFGSWQIAWGQVNRFQRVSSDIDNKFDDNKESIPVGFASSTWGMLPSYTSRSFAGTKKRYGVNGNSFICAVEFGKTVKARSLLAGGESGDEKSPHFFDQGAMYAKGVFKDVWFYKPDVVQHAERWYHPGE